MGVAELYSEASRRIRRTERPQKAFNSCCGQGKLTPKITSAGPIKPASPSFLFPSSVSVRERVKVEVER